MANSVVVWNEPTSTIVPKSATTAHEITGVAKALSRRDQDQIVAAFRSESFEMMAGFVLNKALSQLKRQLASLGMEFVGEMLSRPDINEDSLPTATISNYEAINLARDLGIINATDAKRLTQHAELLAHFDSLDVKDSETEEMSREEALSFLRTCVNSILGREGTFAPIELVRFRSALETCTFKETDNEVQTLKSSPYFFKKTTLSILLSGMKTHVGAKFEHTLGNIIVIIPALWPSLRDTEKWVCGQAYAEVVNAGKSVAVLALKKALTAVRGFDYVPETLRSQTFSAAASNVINVHTAMNNFYNEPAAIGALAKLGTTIPWPAFPICLSAIMAIFLGNSYGHSWAAIGDAEALLTRLSRNQWDYYLNECLPGDELILQKLAWYEKPRVRWSELVIQFELGKSSIKSKDVKWLIEESIAKNVSKIGALGERLLNESRQ
jgi:hypothetical protein